MNSGKKLVDLTHLITPDIPTWDCTSGFASKNDVDYDDCPSDSQFRIQSFTMRAGIGTHIDAPAHVIKGGITIDQLALEDLNGPGIKIDISQKVDKEDYLLSVDDVKAFEKEHGDIQENVIVIVYTGWDKHWNEPKKYHNQHIFPSISKEAAEYLIEKKIAALGIDTLSSDIPKNGFPCHQIVLGAGKFLIENIANASLLPAKDFKLHVMPIKVSGGTEAPVRLAAELKN